MLPPRPKKNYVLFITDWQTTYDALQIFRGDMGDLPLLLGISCGYEPNNSDPYMRLYETGEVSDF